MITIIYSTHKNQEYNTKFKQHLFESVGLNDVQILEYQNNNEHSLAQVYNSGITQSIFDIVVCCHNDIKLEKGWGKKLLDDFKNNQDFSIIGKAGSCYFPETGVYWDRLRQTMVGQVWHNPEGKKWLNTYSPKYPFLVPVVTIDGLFIAFDKNKIKHKFDESYGRFHFYDHGFCIPNFLDGVKLGVTSSFEITHNSVGRPNLEFFETKVKFLEKYKDILPLDLKPKELYIPNNQIQQQKINGKVAVIIPTKGKLEMLLPCIESYYEHCNPQLFDIFIADTGSTEEEKELIQQLISKVDNIKLIEYDYYNFAKINNDVVKNHLTKNHEFILFSNNDIKLMSDIINGMLKTFKSNNRIGTLGCRLHYEDNTIQHDGVVFAFDENMNFVVEHKNVGVYYPPLLNINKVSANTAGLMMMRKFVFDRCGGFNENYTTCFEDVELNLKCLILGLENLCDSSLVGYHYESQTRKNPGRNESERDDFVNTLLPFINKNIKVLSSKIKFQKK